jgi:hypothetical protein
MKLAVIGSRTFHNQNLVNEILDLLCVRQHISITLIISGGAQGVDTLAEEYARTRSIPLMVIKPNYSQYGRSAPIIRNGQIVDQSDYVIAFWDGQSPGTRNTIERATNAGKLVQTVRI